MTPALAPATCHNVFGEKSPARVPRVYWCLCDSARGGSSRIHGRRIHAHLRKQGWTSRLLVDPPGRISDTPLTAADVSRLPLFRENDIVVFQKLRGRDTTALIEHLAARGVITVYVDCDYPPKLRQAQHAAWIVAASQQLARDYRGCGFSRVVYIPDAVEELGANPGHVAKGTELRCAWFGTAGQKRWRSEVEYARTILDSVSPRSWRLVTISNHSDANIAWRLETVFDHLRRCHAVILPVSELSDRAARKSNNRATQAMALGLPVLAHPLVAYQEVVVHGWNGYLCASQSDYATALRELEDGNIRERMGQNALSHAKEFYSLSSIGTLWEEFLTNISNGGDTQCSRRGAPLSVEESLMLNRLRSRALIRMAHHSTDPLSSRARYLYRAVTDWPLENELPRPAVVWGATRALISVLLRRGR